MFDSFFYFATTGCILCESDLSATYEKINVQAPHSMLKMAKTVKRKILQNYSRVRYISRVYTRLNK